MPSQLEEYESTFGQGCLEKYENTLRQIASLDLEAFQHVLEGLVDEFKETVEDVLAETTWQVHKAREQVGNSPWEEGELRDLTEEHPVHGYD